MLEGVTAALDLCAAPGSWSQFLSRQLNSSTGEGRVVAVDLQEIAPIEGVSIVRGDITRLSTAEEVMSRFQGVRPQLVVCDGAPDVNGVHSIDEYLQSQLIFAAVGCAARLLCEGGAFVAKVFKSENMSLMVEQLGLLFSTVEVIKPPSSRIRSAEHFIVAKGYRMIDGWKDLIGDPLISSSLSQSFISSSPSTAKTLSSSSSSSSMDDDIEVNPAHAKSTISDYKSNIHPEWQALKLLEHDIDLLEVKSSSSTSSISSTSSTITSSSISTSSSGIPHSSPPSNTYDSEVSIMLQEAMLLGSTRMLPSNSTKSSNNNTTNDNTSSNSTPG